MVKHYVYAHKHPITKEPFYIGEGTGRRAHEFNGRTDKWREIVRDLKTIGLTHTIEILHICDSKSESRELESIEIKKYKNLVNQQGYNPIDKTPIPVFSDTFKMIGDKIKSVRISAGIPASGLAASLGMSRTTLFKIESGTPQPYDINNLLKVIDKLDIHLRIP